MKKIQVYYKSNYGNVLCYPYCERAKTFIRLTGYKTFNDYHLAQIKQLGYDVENVALSVQEMCRLHGEGL